MPRLLITAMIPALLIGCAPKGDVDELTAQVESLEKRVEELEANKGAVAAGPSAEDEDAAGALYKDARKSLSEGDIDGAKEKIAKLYKDYGRTDAAKAARRTKSELDVVGKKVSTPETEKWYVGSEGDINLDDGATLVVFWEVWCPHCKREVPKVQALYDDYKGKMDVVGLTKITKSATEEKVQSFIDEKGLTYPMAKETGAASKEFGVRGIPAAAIVKDGEIVWRGHPATLNEKMINALIAS